MGRSSWTFWVGPEGHGGSWGGGGQVAERDLTLTQEEGRGGARGCEGAALEAGVTPRAKNNGCPEAGRGRDG